VGAREKEGDMDWALPYTPEQEDFRKEVRAWLDENIPEGMKDPVDARDFSKEHYLFWREKHRDMAAKGWLYPTFPKAYGGGGLSGDHETILDEEFANARVVRAMNNQTGFPALLVWTTDEQKEKFLAPILRGEKVMWQKYTEPRSGADLASYTSRAVRDGDDWLLTGQNVFISGKPRPEWGVEGPDYLFGPMVTDDDAPRHRNMGYFMIPMPSEGLEVREMELLVGHDQHAIFMDNVRVPGDHLIGGDHQGWQVASTTLEQEHGGRGQAFPRDEVVDDLVTYAKNVNGSDPMVQQVTMDAVIDAHRDSLLAKRTYWMYQSRLDINYEGNVANVHNREHDLRNASRVRDVMGMYSLVDRNEPGSPHGGAQEVNQRGKAGQRHAGGSTNIAKVILARRIGVSRTKERAAPTPSTATSHGS
jgi:alkylation response protein AidB-like acyl-CoA dehydrogenase